MSIPRNLTLAVLLVLALVLQVSVFSHAAVDGVVPNLVLLVVIAAALVEGAEFAAVAGFCGGLLIDLAPPAEHVAGRWALALLVAGYVAGRVREGARPTWGSVALVVVACSFVASSVFALSGVVLGDTAASVGVMLRVIGYGVAWDLVLAPLVVPAVILALRRFAPARVAW